MSESTVYKMLILACPVSEVLTLLYQTVNVIFTKSIKLILN